MQCTWWPDVWFGQSIIDCCIAHDLAPAGLASHIQLGRCVAAHGGLAFQVLGAVMVAGVIVGLPFYRFWKRRQSR